MPTGYTSGILEGKINTLVELAILCARSFREGLHMSEKPTNAPYEERTPSNYLVDSLISKRETIEKYRAMTDQELIEVFQGKRKDDLAYYENRIDQCNKNLEKLSLILESARNWVPPTQTHEKIKTFIIDQLVLTIEADTDTSFYMQKIDLIKKQIEKGVDVNAERKNLENELDDYEKSYQMELDKCKECNDWMYELIGSITDWEWEVIKSDDSGNELQH